MGVVLLHELLDFLEFFRRGEFFRQGDACPGGQLDDAVLGEVLHTAANVAGPLILHGICVHVHRHEGQLIEPAGDVALLVHIAHGLAGTHGDAQHAVVLQAHSAGQGGHIAIVAHGVGDIAKGVLHRADVDILNLGVKLVLRYL